MHVGNVPDKAWSRREAAQILATDGGKDLKITNVRIDYDMGPETGSAELTAKGRAGATLHDTFTVLRTAGAWHLVIFGDLPSPRQGVLVRGAAVALRDGPSDGPVTASQQQPSPPSPVPGSVRMLRASLERAASNASAG